MGTLSTSVIRVRMIMIMPLQLPLYNIDRHRRRVFMRHIFRKINIGIKKAVNAEKFIVIQIID